MKLYLAHPYTQRIEGKRIQTEIEKLGVEMINPFERGEQAIYDAKIGPGSNGQGLSNDDCENIVTSDLDKIDQSDGVVALLIDPPNMIGTWMEVFYTGKCTNKFIYAYTPIPRIATHPWIRYFCSNLSATEAELYKTIRESILIEKVEL